MVHHAYFDAAAFAILQDVDDHDIIYDILYDIICTILN